MRVDDDLDDDIDDVDVLLESDVAGGVILDRVTMEVDRLLDSIDGYGVVCGMLDNNIAKSIPD